MSRIVTFTANPAVDVSTAVEKLAPFSKLRCAPARKDPGGGGINVARVVHRLGGDVLAVYPTGDTTGDALHRLVQHEGVACLSVPIAAETRENITVIEEKTGEQYRFVFPGGALTRAEEDRCLEALASVDPAPEFLVASGSLPPNADEDLYRRVAELGRRLGARIVVDSYGPALKQALDVGLYAIKPNLREFRELSGTEGDGDETMIAGARSLIEAGKVEIVALTLGERGAILIGGDVVLRADPLPIEAVSVSGAGDSFLAALLTILADGGSEESALRHAMAAGSAAVLQPGTDLCRAEDVERLLDRVSIRKL